MFASSPGPYGTYDMGGDVFQWNEANIYDEDRALWGGDWIDNVSNLASSCFCDGNPADEGYGTGFRVASVPTGWVPEPSTVALLLASAVCLLGFAWRRRKVA